MSISTLRLTKSVVEALPHPESGQTDYRDSELQSLLLRVGARSKTYSIRKWDGVIGKPVRVKLGKHPEITPEVARQRAMKLLAIEGGLAHAAGAGELDTIQALAKEFLAKHCKPKLKPVPLLNYTWVIDNHIIPKFGKMKVREVSRGHIRSYFETYSEKAASQANKFLVVFSSMMTFALKRDLIDFNPVHGIDKNPTKKRRRVLSDADLRIVCAAFDAQTPLLKHAYWLLLLLAQRRTETCLAEWSEFDLERELWVIPETRTKNGIPQTVPLPPLAKRHLVHLHDLTGHHSHCFWNDKVRRGQREPGPNLPNYLTLHLRRMRKRAPLSDIEHFTVHDLRRTAATNISALLESQEATRRVLNHIDTKSATAHYDLHTYDTIKRKALTAWEERLTRVLRGDEVEELDLESHAVDVEDDD